MFWPFVAASAVAVALIKLGALSVWVVVLKAMLAMVIAMVFAAVLAIGLVYVWRRQQIGFSESQSTL